MDRNGTKLATSERVYNVLDVKQCLRKTNIRAYDQSFKTLWNRRGGCGGTGRIESESLFYNILLKGVDYNTAKEFEAIDEDEEKHPNVKGIWLEEDYVRKYPYNSLASDVIGFSNADDVGTSVLRHLTMHFKWSRRREYGYLKKEFWNVQSGSGEWKHDRIYY
ncbi:MAG: hypothetical protein ACLSXO_03895 [Coprococcus sp.]